MGRPGEGHAKVEAQCEGKWLWFRDEYCARPKGREEFDGLPSAAQAKLTTAMKRHIAGESRVNDIDYLGGGVYEIRVLVLNAPYCVLFVRWGAHRVVLTAFKKDQRANSEKDKERAQCRAARWIELFPHDYAS